MRKQGSRKRTFSVKMDKLQYNAIRSLLPQQYSLQQNHQIKLQKIEEEQPRRPARKNRVKKAEIFEEEDEEKSLAQRASLKTVNKTANVAKQECKATKLKRKIELKTQVKQKSKGNSKGKSKQKSKGKRKEKNMESNKQKSNEKRGQEVIYKSQEQTKELEKQEETSANKQESKKIVAQIRPVLSDEVLVEGDGCQIKVSKNTADKAENGIRRYIKYPYPYHLKTLRRVSQKIRILSQEQRLQIFNDICRDQCSMVDLRELPVTRVLQMVEKIKKMLRQINRSFSQSSDDSSEPYQQSSFESTS